MGRLADDGPFSSLLTTQTGRQMVLPSGTVTSTTPGTSSGLSATSSAQASTVNIVQLRPAVPRPGTVLGTATLLATSSSAGTMPIAQTLTLSGGQRVTLKSTEQLRLTQVSLIVD